MKTERRRDEETKTERERERFKKLVFFSSLRGVRGTPTNAGAMKGRSFSPSLYLFSLFLFFPFFFTPSSTLPSSDLVSARFAARGGGGARARTHAVPACAKRTRALQNDNNDATTGDRPRARESARVVVARWWRVRR